MVVKAAASWSQGFCMAVAWAQNAPLQMPARHAPLPHSDLRAGVPSLTAVYGGPSFSIPLACFIFLQNPLDLQLGIICFLSLPHESVVFIATRLLYTLCPNT